MSGNLCRCGAYPAIAARRCPRGRGGLMPRLVRTEVVMEGRSRIAGRWSRTTPARSTTPTTTWPSWAIRTPASRPPPGSRGRPVHLGYQPAGDAGRRGAAQPPRQRPRRLARPRGRRGAPGRPRGDRARRRARPRPPAGADRRAGVRGGGGGGRRRRHAGAGRGGARGAGARTASRSASSSTSTRPRPAELHRRAVRDLARRRRRRSGGRRGGHRRRVPHARRSSRTRWRRTAPSPTGSRAG